MAWIKVREPHELNDELLELYANAEDPESGEVDNILSIHSLHPAGLRAHFELYRTVMTGSRSLRKVERELIALVVSQANSCHY